MTRAVLAELFGLFVDDGLLAAALLAWTAVAAAIRFLLPTTVPILAPIYALGCLAVLLASIQRSSRSTPDD